MRRIMLVGLVIGLVVGTFLLADTVVRTSPMYPWPLYLISTFGDLLNPL
ncbi:MULTISPECIES: hypothetical protein [Pseudomonas]|nr:MULTISPECIES: hypothetical protein [Pseudomonas]MCE1116812.1 hypothetical protein [Pseudomonas sp. NMI795_08]